MNAIYLTGFMGAGKTTIGRELSRKLNLPVIDTDEFIEEKAGEEIQTIFEQKGEQTFRTYERIYLKQLPSENIIITTGGGIVLQKENRDWMKKVGYVIYLHCEPDVILNRLKSDTTRPLLNENKQEKIYQLFNERLSFYQEADYRIDTSFRTTDEVVKIIIDTVKNLSDGDNS